MTRPRYEYDPFSGDLVISAPDRADRPHAFRGDQDEVRCPFCPGHESDTPPELMRLEGDVDWDMRLVPNRYPAVDTGDDDGEDEEMARGRHEVLIESPDHLLQLEDFGIDRLTALLQIYRDRFRLFRESKSLAWWLAFRNRGRAAGESLEHPHSQIIALDRLPPHRFPPGNGTCPACHAAAGSPLEIAGDEALFVFAPAHARLPHEAWIAPRTHRGRFEDSGDAELKNLASLLHRTLLALAVRIGRAAPLNWFLRTAPAGKKDHEYHWHLAIVPRLTNIGGFELASGMMINVVEPTRTAAELRAALRGTR